jgi:hypothetical protein
VAAWGSEARTYDAAESAYGGTVHIARAGTRFSV